MDHHVPSSKFIRLKKKGGVIFNNEINLKINKYIKPQNILPSISKEILLDGMRTK